MAAILKIHIGACSPMNIRFFETLIQLSELRNFRATAARLNMTPAAISNRIGAMEQELGFRLFERNARDVKLTPNGETFVDGARDVVRRYQELIEAISPQAEFQGTLKIGIVSSLAMTILPSILDIVRQRHPRIQVSVTTSSSRSMTQKLEQRELDIVLAVRPEPSAHLRTIDICTFGMFWISRSNYMSWETVDVLSRDDLLNANLISYESGSYNYQRIIDYFTEDRLRGARIHYSNSLTTTINMIASGVGISVIPPVTIQKELRSGELQILNTDFPFPATSYSAIYLESSATPLITLIANIARDAGREVCVQFNESFAYQE